MKKVNFQLMFFGAIAKKVVIAAMFFELAACCPRNWRIAADVGTGVAVTSLACDGGSTDQYLRDSQWVEINPVLGERPGDLRLWSYLGAIAAALLVTDRYVPPKWQLVIAGAVTAIEIDSIRVNMGVGSSFCGIGKGGPWRPIPTSP